MNAVYRELVPDRRLRPFVECGWVRSGPSAAPVRVMPDGCVDLFVAANGEVLIAGPATTFYDVSAGALAGLRLRPGAAAAVIGLPAHELRDVRISIDSVFGGAANRLAETIRRTAVPAQRLILLQEMVAARLTNADPSIDPSVARAIEVLQARPDRPVSALADEVFLSERQLRRRFDAAVGYGPKRLGRVFRLQRLLDLIHATNGRAQWADVAVAAGYADQSHMVNECVALAGVTPTALPGGMSVSSNTAKDCPS